MIHPITHEMRENLKKVVKKFGTQSEFANHIGVKQQSISKYLTTASYIRDEQYHKIKPFLDSVTINNHGNVTNQVVSGNIYSSDNIVKKIINEITQRQSISSDDKIRLIDIINNLNI